MNIYLAALFIFTVTVIVIELLSYGYGVAKHPDRALIRRKLRKMAYRSKQVEETTDITRKTVLSEIPFLNNFLKKADYAHALQRLLYQANASYSTGFYIMLMLFIGFIGYYVLSFRQYAQPVPILGALIAGAIPVIYLKLKRRKRMEKFLRQLPEALDMIASSLRAGHAFSTGMMLASEEFDDPLGPEFEITLDEINFGVGLSEALQKMTERVSCGDLNFFVIAVILQRETGGNLAEILENISNLIRERFKLFGKIRALAAEGNISMYVLLSLPIAMAAVLSYINPEYIGILFAEPLGRILIGFASVLMVLGTIVMKNMIRIKV